MKIIHILVLSMLVVISSYGQADRWQQAIKYKMDIEVDSENNQYAGHQYVQYYNNSPDTLNRIFYHLYFNAFQPNSMMDTRSRTIADPDGRVLDRIQNLKENEIGFHKILSLTQNGKKTNYEVVGTILEVDLAEPILPGESALMDMRYVSQVPLQVRRSGRDNKEGIRLSMSQWYPKVCEYDYQGWHTNPYVGREFHGVWGDFDVKITIDKDYIIGATGVLQNAENIGYGYQKNVGKEPKKKGKSLTWHFLAENVHDFVWAADPDYTHTKITAHDGTVLHFLFQPGEDTSENWAQLPDAMDEALKWINKNYGKYPYPVYSFIQGGDGGMEYPMATLITGKRKWSSLVGVSIHELMHSWYQMILGTNEALYPWMDEGFTSYASAETMNYLKKKGKIPGELRDNPTLGAVRSYANFTQTGMEEPLSTHADHYMTNRAYGLASYVKGSATLAQLQYIIGKKDFQSALLRYYDTWKFKHPNTNDFIRIMEKESNLELDWFKEYWVNTTHQIDYAVDTLINRSAKTTEIVLSRQGVFPMPIDLTINYKDGSSSKHNIALRMMRGNKGSDSFTYEKIEEDWPWTHPTYSLTIDSPIGNITSVIIDESKRMADVNLDNNIYPRQVMEEEQPE